MTLGDNIFNILCQYVKHNKLEWIINGNNIILKNLDEFKCIKNDIIMNNNYPCLYIII